MAVHQYKSRHKVDNIFRYHLHTTSQILEQTDLPLLRHTNPNYTDHIDRQVVVDCLNHQYGIHVALQLKGCVMEEKDIKEI